MKRLMKKMLNISGVIVEDSIQTESTLILSVRAEKKTAICPRCGQTSHRLHQNKRHLVKDLPMGDREVILRVNRRQFKCGTCRKPFSETLDFLESRKNFTRRYAQNITKQVIHSDVNNVAKNNKLTSKEVWSMVMTEAEKIIPIDVKDLKRLGIDEISLVKGQGKFIVVLVDLSTQRAKLFNSLKGSKYTLLKAEDKLCVRQKEKLKRLKEAAPLVGIMHSFKEDFHDLFENSKDLGEGTLKLIDWLKKAEPYYKKSVATIKRWFAEIVGYFERRTTNGIVEGINNKLKLLKRSGFGFKNFNNFSIRALLYWHFSDDLAY